MPEWSNHHRAQPHAVIEAGIPGVRGGTAQPRWEQDTVPDAWSQRSARRLRQDTLLGKNFACARGRSSAARVLRR